MITRKDLEMLAHAFADARMFNRRHQNGRDMTEGATTLEIELAETFREINPRFDQVKFFKRVQHLENVRLGRATPDQSTPLG